MPLRPFNREQAFLLPPSLDELVPADHSVRFVDALLDGLGEADWRELGIELEGDPNGAPAYHPRALLGVWLYGFMSGTRSSRKLEQACREQMPYVWLTGLQWPDHNTLWRFWQEHRAQMHRLLPLTVRMAVETGLLDLAFQAVDASRVQASASKERTLDQDGLMRLMRRVHEEIEELERQNGAENSPQEPRLPEDLAEKRALLGKVHEALERIRGSGEKRTNLTDKDAVLLKSRTGFIAGYSAHIAVSPLAGTGPPEPEERLQPQRMLITAAVVAASVEDQPHLVPVIREASVNTGDEHTLTLADGGYHSGENLSLLRDEKRVALMPESGRRREPGPYDKACFVYHAEDNTYTCPEGQRLRFDGVIHRKGRPPVGRWRAEGKVCRGCRAFGECTANRMGRIVEAGPHEGLLAAHRRMMGQEWAKALYAKRKQVVEPVFGMIKEQQQARRFLLRGIANVKAEWSLLAAAFNLRMLSAMWREGRTALSSSTPLSSAG